MVTAPEELQFDVILTRDFALAMVPASGSVIQGSATMYTITATGSEGFSNLVMLGVNGLPAGITGTLSAPTITAGGSVTLSIEAAEGASVTSAPINFAIEGDTQVDGVAITRSTAGQLSVLAGSRTGIIGQFVLLNGPPLAGVLLQLDGQTAETDAGGNFQFLDVSPGKHTMSVDATPADPLLPIYGIDLVAVEGEVTRFDPFKICPPLPPERYTPIDNMQEDQPITDPTAPGAVFTLPKGVVITGWDDEPKTQMTIQKLGIDELPVPPPPGQTRSFYQPFFGTPMGGLPTAPIPVTLPNDLDLDPGEKAELWSYDAAPFPGQPGEWRFGGLGTVSEDGSQIVSDPGVGITRFCGVCGLSCFLNQQENQENYNPDGPTGGDPVNLALGQMIVDKTDLVLPGRIPAIVHRTYNPLDPFAVSRFQLGIGPGWFFSVDVVLQEETESLRRLILPGNARSAFRRQPDGTFRNDDNARFAGAVLRMLSTGIHELRFKDGTVWRFTTPNVAGLNGIGLLVEQRDRNNNRLVIDRGGGVQIERLIEPAGRELVFTNQNGRPVEITDPLGRAVIYEYDSAGRLAVVTDPAGGTTRYGYDSQGRIVTITDARNITYLTNEYGPDGRVKRQVQADGGEWAFDYEYVCRPLALDAAPTGASRQVLPSNPCAPAEFIGLAAINVTDPRGNSTRTRLNGDGWPVEFVDELGQKTRFERGRHGQITKVTDPLGRSTRYQYDLLGNLIDVTDTFNQSYKLDYEPEFAQPIRVTDPAGNSVTFEYTSSGNLSAIVDAEQNALPGPNRSKVLFTYDEFGQLQSISDQLGNTTTLTHDSNGNLAMTSDPLGNRTFRTFDLASRLVAQTDARGRTTRYNYDKLNNVREIVGPDGTLTRFEHDANGNLLSVSDPLNHTRRYEYDVMDQLRRFTDPLGSSETFSYDASGNLTSYIDRNGSEAAYSYDDANRNTRVARGGSLIDFRYDAIGRLVEAAGPSSSKVLIEYDTFDRVTRQITTDGATKFTYDLLGRRTSMEVSGGSAVQYSYDRNSRLTNVEAGPVNATLEYDELGRRVRTVMASGITIDHTYDSLSRVRELTYRYEDDVVGNLTYEYDFASNPTSLGGSFSRSVLPASVDTAEYDAADRLVAFGNKALSFDSNGNLLSVSGPNGLTVFGWDASNRLQSIDGPGIDANFSYDGFGRRVHSEINGQARKYLYDIRDVIVENSVDQVDIEYVRTLFLDDLIAAVHDDGTYYYLADRYGTTMALMDGAGEVSAEYAYEPFGGTTIDEQKADLNRFQFTGRENDGTGLYFYRARYYSPELHRFISEDPISTTWSVFAQQALRRVAPADVDSLVEHLGGDAGLHDLERGVVDSQSLNSNQYSYALNSPLAYTDPTGEFVPQLVGCAVGAGVSLGLDYFGGRKFDVGNAAIGCALGATGGYLGSITRWLPNAKGFEVVFSRNFRIGWHRFTLRGRQVHRPHWHSRPGIGRHRPWE